MPAGIDLVMKSYKCSKVKMHRVLAKVLRNAPEKIQRKKQTIEAEKKMMKKAKLQVVATIKKS